jgi:hypothetical protein
MKVGGMAKISVAVVLAILLLAAVGQSGGRNATAGLRAPGGSNPHCTAVGGSVMTNFGAIDQNTTMGTATGDLKGAVSGTILGQPQKVGNTVVFQVQHHWVTESGDTLDFEPATATTVPLSATLFAIVTYPVHLTGGTGKFAGASGEITNIGEVDLVKGTVFRYSGQVCFGGED